MVGCPPSLVGQGTSTARKAKYASLSGGINSISFFVHKVYLHTHSNSAVAYNCKIPAPCNAKI
jgi:hypothetical protein